jgi:hypothetical protein
MQLMTMYIQYILSTVIVKGNSNIDMNSDKSQRLKKPELIIE